MEAQIWYVGIFKANNLPPPLPQPNRTLNPMPREGGNQNLFQKTPKFWIIFFWQHFFRPKLFWPTFFWSNIFEKRITKHISWLNFWPNSSFSPSYFFPFFWPKLPWTNNFLNIIFFAPKFCKDFFYQNCFDKQFCLIGWN